MSETETKIPDRIYVQFAKTDVTFPAISLRMWSLEPFKGCLSFVLDEAEHCIACGKTFLPGDMVLPDASGGAIHVECCGPEPESYTDADGNPLKSGDPVPAGTPWEPLP